MVVKVGDWIVDKVSHEEMLIAVVTKIDRDNQTLVRKTYHTRPVMYIGKTILGSEDVTFMQGSIEYARKYMIRYAKDILAWVFKGKRP